MKRLLTTAGALAIAAVMAAGVAHANPEQQGVAVAPEQLPQVRAPEQAQWHYVWQYHYTKWGQYLPEWVAIPNDLR